MNSSQLTSLNFEGWWDFGEYALLEPADYLRHIPRQHGVYVLRTSYEFGRFIGKSDIAYVGRTSSLRGRLGTHLRESWQGRETTSSRLREALWEGPSLELGYVPLSSSIQALQYECFLLDEYERDHRELPPLNLRRRELSYERQPLPSSAWVGELYRVPPKPGPSPEPC